MANLTGLELLAILSAGILPALVWLWFWLKEDLRKPEPKGFIVLSFFAGALSILLVLKIEEGVAKEISKGPLLFLIWAFIEEIAKLTTAYIVALRKKIYDEPVDAMIYLITVALGFAAFENVLFIIKGYGESGLVSGLLTASMRFLGASLLHVLSSAVLGGIMAHAFCKGKIIKVAHTLAGIAFATILHTLFNLFIIRSVVTDTPAGILTTFLVLWVGVVLLIAFFEKVKHVVCYDYERLSNRNI